MPEGIDMVLDLVVADLAALAAGVCDIFVVVVFDELLLIVLVVGAVWAWAEMPPASSRAVIRLKKRFMKERKKVKNPAASGIKYAEI